MRAASTMGTWKTAQIKKKSRGSQSTGKSKGIFATTIQKFMCRRNRSWKHPLYDEVMKSCEIKKGGKSK